MEKGYSLVELLVVLSLFLVVFTLAIPGIAGADGRLGAEALKNQIQQDLNWALHYADTYQKPLLVQFSLGNNLYFVKEGNQALLKRSYSPRFRLETNFENNRFWIYANGTVERGGTIVIREKNRVLFRLYVQLVTGSVREERP